jgi:hypothetical protein
VVRAVLCGGFYPNVARSSPGAGNSGRWLVILHFLCHDSCQVSNEGGTARAGDARINGCGRGRGHAVGRLQRDHAPQRRCLPAAGALPLPKLLSSLLPEPAAVFAHRSARPSRRWLCSSLPRAPPAAPRLSRLKMATTRTLRMKTTPPPPPRSDLPASTPPLTHVPPHISTSPRPSLTFNPTSPSPRPSTHAYRSRWSSLQPTLGSRC